MSAAIGVAIEDDEVVAGAVNDKKLTVIGCRSSSAENAAAGRGRGYIAPGEVCVPPGSPKIIHVEARERRFRASA
jgi:hypothetical protein